MILPDSHLTLNEEATRVVFYNPAMLDEGLERIKRDGAVTDAANSFLCSLYCNFNGVGFIVWYLKMSGIDSGLQSELQPQGGWMPSL